MGRKGATLLGVAADQSLLGMLAVQDTLKQGRREVMRTIAERSPQRFTWSRGDNPLTAQAIASEAGIPSENVFAEVRPEQKSQFIWDLAKAAGAWHSSATASTTRPRWKRRIMGIAVSRASDVAREAADIILLKSEIQAIPEALGLARATLRTIKWNLFWAFFTTYGGHPAGGAGFI